MHVRTAVSLSVLLLAASQAMAAQIRGDYLEARTCDVYTGPCFANGEMGLAGKEALMAWIVEQGSWNDVDLTGLSVALVLNAEGTLGDDGVFGMEAGRIDSLILVGENADAAQREALAAFVRDSAPNLTRNVVRVQATALELSNDHISGIARFSAGEFAKIETRGLTSRDCVCSNEIVFYQPLTPVKDVSPAFTKTFSFRGEGLTNRWTSHNSRSAFMATFRR